MATIADLRPGARICNANDQHGTLTCFAIKPATPHKLYGVTAGHVLTPRGSCWLGSHQDAQKIWLGGPAHHAQGADLCYFRIDEDVKAALTRANFLPVGHATDIGDLWNPGKLRARVDGAQFASLADPMKRKTMAVKHFGATTLVPPVQGGIDGHVDKWTDSVRTQVRRTNIAPGDSGGPVLDANKNRLIGLVSSGHAQGPSTEGGIVILHDVFAQLGLAIAGWHNRGMWKMPML